MTVRGDPDELQTAVLNVLGNAIKYSPNGADVRVALSVEQEAWVRVSITDQGIGIPAAHLKRIFRRFYRVPSRSVLRTKGHRAGACTWCGPSPGSTGAMPPRRVPARAAAQR